MFGLRKGLAEDRTPHTSDSLRAEVPCYRWSNKSLNTSPNGRPGCPVGTFNRKGSGRFGFVNQGGLQRRSDYKCESGAPTGTH